MKISEIPRYTCTGNYSVHVSWGGLERWLESEEEMNLNLDPDFQRAHVWSKDQQAAYVLYRLRGGYSGDILYWNHPGYNSGKADGGELEIVDGKQRLEAVRRFMRNDLEIYQGFKLKDFEDEPDMLRGARFQVVINDLKTRAEVLGWYLDLNAGGTPHTEDEIRKVRGMLAQEALTI